MSPEDKPGPLRIVFWSSTEFGLPTLAYLLHSAECEVPLIITKAPAPAGRKHELTPTPISTYARANAPGVKIAEPEKLAHNDALKERIEDCQPDAYVLASFGMILPESYLKLVEHPLCLHPSKLPDLRGPSPIREALKRGHHATAISVMKMVRQMDAGPVMIVRSLQIDPDDDFETLREKLAKLAVQCTYSAIRAIQKGEAQYEPQDEAAATYTSLIKPSDTSIDFARKAEDIVNLVRAFSPDIGAVCLMQDGKRLKILRASVRQQEIAGAVPGTVLSVRKHSFEVACGDENVLVVHELQPEGKRRMSAQEFLAGRNIIIGDVLQEVDEAEEASEHLPQE
jgi:methionyl-tRNA formyltransferase